MMSSDGLDASIEDKEVMDVHRACQMTLRNSQNNWFETGPPSHFGRGNYQARTSLYEFWGVGDPVDRGLTGVAGDFSYQR